MTKFNENISVEETEAYKMGELMEASREVQEAEASAQFMRFSAAQSKNGTHHVMRSIGRTMRMA